MNGPNKKKVESLSEWLEIATKGLVPAAKERIAQEIETHFSEAVETHLKHGEQESVAKIKAVVELGDPKVAGKRFRKKHLTEKEAKKLSLAQKRAGSIKSLFFFCFVSVFYYFFLVIVTDSFAKRPKLDLFFFVLALFLAGIVLPTITFLIMRRRQLWRNICALPLMQSIECAAFSLAFALTMTTFVRFLCLISMFWAMGGFSWLQIWDKVRKTGDDESGAPRPV